MSWASTAYTACQQAMATAPAGQAATACVNAFKASMLQSASTSPQGQQATAASLAENAKVWAKQHWVILAIGGYILIRR